MQQKNKLSQAAFALIFFLNATQSNAERANDEAHSSAIFDKTSIERTYLTGVENIQQGNCEVASRYFEEVIRQSSRTIRFYDAAINAYTQRSREDQTALTQAIRSIESLFGNYVVDLGFDRNFVMSISSRSGLYLAECYVVHPEQRGQMALMGR